MYTEKVRNWREHVVSNARASNYLAGLPSSPRLELVQQAWIDNLITLNEMREIVFEWYGIDA